MVESHVDIDIAYRPSIQEGSINLRSLNSGYALVALVWNVGSVQFCSHQYLLFSDRVRQPANRLLWPMLPAEMRVTEEDQLQKTWGAATTWGAASNMRSSYVILANQPDTICSWPESGSCRMRQSVLTVPSRRTNMKRSRSARGRRQNRCGGWMPALVEQWRTALQENHQHCTYMNKHEYERAVQFLIQIKRK